MRFAVGEKLKLNRRVSLWVAEEFRVRKREWQGECQSTQENAGAVKDSRKGIREWT
jgi:hypothetical protein